jgi:hypothetical protein
MQGEDSGCWVARVGIGIVSFRLKATQQSAAIDCRSLY